MVRPHFVQLPLPTLDGLAYPRHSDGFVHQCAWCRRGLDRAGRFRIWAAALRESPRMSTPFDEAWFAQLLAKREAVQQASEPARAGSSAAAVVTLAQVHPAEQRQDWGDAPDVLSFVGRIDELATVRDWVLQERCRLVGVVGMGGIGKTSMVARVVQDAAPDFQRVYWRSLRNAPPASD